GHQPAVISPIEAYPRATFPNLILHVGCLIKFLIVIDTEDASRSSGRRPGSADLWKEKARRDARHYHQRRESVEVRHAHASCERWNFRSLPSDREKDWRISQHAEVIRIARVLGNVLA